MKSTLSALGKTMQTINPQESMSHLNKHGLAAKITCPKLVQISQKVPKCNFIEFLEAKLQVNSRRPTSRLLIMHPSFQKMHTAVDWLSSIMIVTEDII